MSDRRQSGSVVLALIALLFVLALVGGGFYFLGATGTEAIDPGKAARGAYDEAVNTLERALGDPRNFEASLPRNSTAFACLFSATAECAGKGGAFLFYEDGTRTQPVSQLGRGMGINGEGLGCKGFPSPNCPVRVETVWEPVCNGPRCEGTKSVRVKAKVTMQSSAEEKPLEWTRESLFSPSLQLSAAVTCERGGGVWANTECLTPAQASERQLASSGRRVSQAEGGAEGGSEPMPSPVEPSPAAAPAPPQYDCPAQIVVQGQYYPVQFLSAERGQVSVPAMSCQMDGYYDVFVFQCAAKDPTSGSNEGQWVQVEAVMAPSCDPNGRPLGEAPRL